MSKACAYAAALTGASIPTLEHPSPLWYSLLPGGKIARREQEQVAHTCSESDSRRHRTPSQTLGYQMTQNVTQLTSKPFAWVAPLLFRLEISMLGSLLQCNTQGRRRGAQGKGGPVAALGCTCGSARMLCAAMLQRLKWLSRSQLFRCAKVCVCNDKVKRPPVVHAGKRLLAHAWLEILKSCMRLWLCIYVWDWKRSCMRARFFTRFSQTWASIKFQPCSLYISQNLFLIEAYNPTWCNKPQKRVSGYSEYLHMRLYWVIQKQYSLQLQASVQS